MRVNEKAPRWETRGFSRTGKRGAGVAEESLPVRVANAVARSVFPFSARWRLSRDCCVAEARRIVANQSSAIEWRKVFTTFDCLGISLLNLYWFEFAGKGIWL
jgi:hypothetical protein